MDRRESGVDLVIVLSAREGIRIFPTILNCSFKNTTQRDISMPTFIGFCACFCFFSSTSRRFSVNAHVVAAQRLQTILVLIM